MSSSPYKPQPGITALQPHNINVPPTYSHVTTSSGPSTIITTAGQVGRHLDGTVPSSLPEQIRLAFANLRQCLAAAGATPHDVLKLTYYIVDYDHTNRVHFPALIDFLGDARSAITLVPVVKLAVPEFKVEVEATAAVRVDGVREVEVVVVGGGLSGLQAARDLQAAGVGCVVLEARDRVGGKTWSREVGEGKGVVDMGAAWINSSNQSRMYSLAQRYGLGLVKQNTDGDMVSEAPDGIFKRHPYGEPLQGLEDKAHVKDMIRIRNRIEELCQKIDLEDPVQSGLALGKDYDKITVEEFVRSEGGGEAALNAIRVSTRALLGLEPSEMSALYLLDYCKSGGGIMLMRSDREHGGQYLRIKKVIFSGNPLSASLTITGTQSFSKGLASELAPESIVLNSPVRSIQQRGNEILVTSARGSYRCKRVVVSIPTPLYKEISFDPSLPEAKLKLSQTSKLGDYCKMFLVYERPWWREAALCGLLQSSTGPAAVTRDTSVDENGQYSLGCFVTGEPARAWAKLTAEQRRESILDEIRTAYGHLAKVEEPINVVEQIWRMEQWSQGCPCPALPPGGLTELGHTLRAPFGGVHFVGTEMALVWKGYMEGAVRSGEAGAEEVLRQLGKAKL